jgi:hypothetical protein
MKNKLKAKKYKYQNIDISMFVIAEISVIIRGDHCVRDWKVRLTPKCGVTVPG